MTLFRQESLDHKRHKLHGEVILVQPVSFYILTLVFFIITAVMVGFLALGKYTRKETVAGYIAPEQGLSVIRTDQSGRLTQIFIQEGSKIKAGAPLFEVSIDVETSAGLVGARRLQNTDKRLAELKKQMDNIQSRYKRKNQLLKAQAKNLASEIATLKRRLTLQQEYIAVLTKQKERYETLAKTATIPKTRLDTIIASELSQKINLETIAQNITSREGALEENLFAQKALPDAKKREISQLQLQISSLEQNRVELEISTSYLVRSPVDGTVTALQGKTGQTLPANMPVVMIVPEGSSMVANLLAPSTSIGFLEPGQNVNLLIDAFPYQKFGVQKGVIKEISKTPFLPGEFIAPIPFETAVYRVTISLNKQTVLAYGNKIHLKTGMTLKGDLIVDKRTLLEWMFDPLLSLRKNAG